MMTMIRSSRFTLPIFLFLVCLSFASLEAASSPSPRTAAEAFEVAYGELLSEGTSYSRRLAGLDLIRYLSFTSDIEPREFVARILRADEEKVSPDLLASIVAWKDGEFGEGNQKQKIDFRKILLDGIYLQPHSANTKMILIDIIGSSRFIFSEHLELLQDWLGSANSLVHRAALRALASIVSRAMGLSNDFLASIAESILQRNDLSSSAHRMDALIFLAEAPGIGFALHTRPALQERLKSSLDSISASLQNLQTEDAKREKAAVAKALQNISSLVPPVKQDDPVYDDVKNDVLTKTPVGRKKILVVLSSARRMQMREGESLEVGTFLVEMGEPIRRFKQLSYEIEIATPDGVFPTLDASGLELWNYWMPYPWRYFNARARRDQDLKTAQEILGKLKFTNSRTTEGVQNLISDLYQKQEVKKLGAKQISSVEKIAEKKDFSEYAGIFVPGGHAPMVDLGSNAALGKILRQFYTAGKMVAAICHGPYCFLSVEMDPEQKSKEDFIFEGKRIAVLRKSEERLVEIFSKWTGLYLNGNHVPFFVDKALSSAGLKPIPAWIWTGSRVIVDGDQNNLITGGNPASTTKLSKACEQFLKRLSGER